MKYLGILSLNLKEYIQDLYAESYKTLRKGIKESLNKWIYHIPGLEELMVHFF